MTHKQRENMQTIMFALLAVVFLNAAVFVSAGDENILKTSNNGFAIDIYKKIVSRNQGKNVFLSPTSIETALAMVAVGAKGNTRTQLRDGLHLSKLGISDDEINRAYKNLLGSFKEPGNNFTLHVANRLFGRKEFQLEEQYLKDTRDYFQASLEALDFQKNPEGSRTHINKWVEDQTMQKIKDLLPAKSITAETNLVLVNAIYFKAFWEQPFPKEYTKPGPFHTSRTEQVQMDMMKLSRNLNYLKSMELDCQVLELPYVSNKASMFVFLPNEIEGLSQLQERLTGKNLGDALNGVQQKKVHLDFPKFTIDQDVSLKQFLQMLGINDLFDPQKSDLSGIAAGPLVIADAIHKAFVAVDEAGTEAAAATALIAVGSSLPVEPPIQFVVDHPFIFLIVEKKSQSVLFLGHLSHQPKGKESIGSFGATAEKQTSSSANYRGNGQLLMVIWSLMVVCLFQICTRILDSM